MNSTFHIAFKAYNDKTKAEHLGKNPQNYLHEHDVTSIFKQKLIKIDDFDMEEEKQVKERVEERKIKRREVAKKQAAEKKKKLKITKKLKKKCGIGSKSSTKTLRTLKNPKRNPKKCQKRS